MEKYIYKNLFRGLNENAPLAVGGSLIDVSNLPTGIKPSKPIQILSRPQTEWAIKVDEIEQPFAPVYDNEEYENNPALTAMGLFEMMDMLEAFGVPRKRQTDYFNKPLSGKKFMVAGCGTGREVIALAALGASVTGFDATKRYAEICSQKATTAEMALGELDIKLYQALAENFNYGSKADGITSLFGVINHVQDWKQAIISMTEGLKTDGTLVIEKYGPNNALVFDEIRRGLPYKPSILQKRAAGGILLGDNIDEVLPAVFPDDNEFSDALLQAGLTITGKRGYLRYASLYPKNPTTVNLIAFKNRVRELDPDAADFIGRFEDPNDILYAAMLKDRMPRRQKVLDDYAYALYVCRKDS